MALSEKEIQINVHVVNVCAAGENWVMGEGHWVKRNNEDELQKKTEWIYVQEEKEMEGKADLSVQSCSGQEEIFYEDKAEGWRREKKMEWRRMW